MSSHVRYTSYQILPSSPGPRSGEVGVDQISGEEDFNIGHLANFISTEICSLPQHLLRINLLEFQNTNDQLS